MNKTKFCAVALVLSAALTATSAFGQAPVPPPQLPIPQAAIAASAEENLELVPSNAPESLEITGTKLSPPVAITYKGTSTALAITDSGSGSGLSSTLSNPSDNGSAVFGGTVGGGAGITGVASGPTGFGGVFEITDSSNGAAAVSAISSGTGSAIVGKLVGKSAQYQPAIAGANLGSPNSGVGVEGLGNSIGVYGVSDGTNGGVGVFGKSSSGPGVQATSDKGDGLDASSTYGYGITARSVNGAAIFAFSRDGDGIVSQSKNAIGVTGEDTGTGIGIYGSSASGYAGYFAGKAAAYSFVTLSDRNAKTDFESVNGADVLERISRLPITSWEFKNEPTLRHIGPTAQDFHAAFGLSGQDDTHINMADSAGVSLAAIQELNKRLKQKDAQIARSEAQIAEMQASFTAQLKAMRDEFSARVAKLEQRSSGTAGTAIASLKSEPRVSALSETRE